MSVWNHALCDRCWTRRMGDRPPHRLLIPEGESPPPAETCCDCGQPTTSGIYVRGAPESFGCNGYHPEQPVIP